MSPGFRSDRFGHSGGVISSCAALVACALLSLWAGSAEAQRRERTGKEVVDVTCGRCHVPGTDKAPRIGDKAAWAPRVSQGLGALTEHALNGIRKMPAHGGAIGISDIEIERAIVHMVNLSGGHWTEPVGGATPARLRGSEQIVKGQCSKCHEPGMDGAPRIGDRTAWTPRLRKGLDALVASAVHGHGAMPARGGLPDLSDEEIRGAIVYMFNFGLPATPPQAAEPRADPYHRVVSGTDIYLGMISADALRRASAEGRAVGIASGEIPSGKGVVHINISLADAKSNMSITDAEVTVKVADAMRAETRTLDLVAANNAVSYGGFFHLSGGGLYTITVQVRRPGPGETLETRFEYKSR